MACSLLAASPVKGQRPLQRMMAIIPAITQLARRQYHAGPHHSARLSAERPLALDYIMSNSVFFNFFLRYNISKTAEPIFTKSSRKMAKEKKKKENKKNNRKKKKRTEKLVSELFRGWEGGGKCHFFSGRSWTRFHKIENCS